MEKDVLELLLLDGPAVELLRELCGQAFRAVDMSEVWPGEVAAARMLRCNIVMLVDQRRTSARLWPPLTPTQDKALAELRRRAIAEIDKE